MIWLLHCRSAFFQCGIYLKKVDLAISLMRLDLFLKASRLVPRRSLAQEFCSAGLIEVNGSSAKSSKEVKLGDEVTIKRRNRITRIAVAAIPSGKQVAKSAASELYRVISDESNPASDPLS